MKGEYGRDDGRDQGRDEITTFLYLKAFQAMDGRDEGFFENSIIFIRNRQAHLKPFDLICLMIPTLGMVCSHTGN